MKIEAKDKEKNGATKPPWPTVLKIDNGEEFQQSLAIAELAVRLCELKLANPKTLPIEKEVLDPNKFLEQAWELIQSARQQVLRPQTNAKYLAEHGGSHEAAENVVARILSASRVPFQKLCNEKETYTKIDLHDAETGKTIELEWKVYKSEAGFNKLFWAYWRVTSSLRLRMIVSPDAPGNVPDNWEEYGEALLASWKKNGVPPNDFLALATFRREHDQRAANLKKPAEAVA